MGISPDFPGRNESNPFQSRCARWCPFSLVNMADQFAIQIKNSYAAVHAANETVSRWLSGRGAPAEVQYFANLAIEEFGTNSIKYGYDDLQEHLIDVGLSLSDNQVVLTIVDDGRAFNPLEAPEPNLKLPIDERPIGGLGIYLVRKMCDTIDYAREGNKNKLILRKTFRRA